MLSRDAHVEEEAGDLAVLRHHADAGGHAVPGPAAAKLAAAEPRRCPPVRRRAPNIASQNSERPEPIRPARQTISPARTVSEHRAHEGRRRDAPRPRARPSPSAAAAVARGPARPRGRPSAGSARRAWSSATVAGAGEPAVLEHRHAVAELEDLRQPVRDVDHRHALARRGGGRRRTAASVSVRVSAAVGSSRIRSGGPATAPWRSRRSAPAPARARATGGRGSMRDAELRDQRRAPGRASRRRSMRPEPARRLPAGEDVLGDRELRDQRALLVDDADAERLRRLLVDARRARRRRAAPRRRRGA